MVYFWSSDTTVSTINIDTGKTQAIYTLPSGRSAYGMAVDVAGSRMFASSVATSPSNVSIIEIDLKAGTIVKVT